MIGVAAPAKQMMRPMTISSVRIGRPRGRPTRIDGSSCRIKGTDFLTSVTIGGTSAVAGEVLTTSVVNPKRLGIARLATMATLFERYKFKSLKFRYAPACPTNTAGQLLGYVDYDTYDDPTGLTGVQNLQRAAAHYGEKPVEVWGGTSPVFWEIKDIDPMTDLYVDSDETDPRWTNQGRFVLLAATAIANGTVCGNIYLDYDIEFYIPQVELTPTNGYAYRLVGGGSLSSTDVFGTVPVAGSWNNLPVLHTASTMTFTIPAGSFSIWSYVAGTTVSAYTFTGGTSVYEASIYNAAANVGMFVSQRYSAVPWTLTAACTAAAVAGSQIMISLLPSSAVTLSQRKLDRLAKTVDSFADLKEFKIFLESKRSEELKESQHSLDEKHFASSMQARVSQMALQLEKPMLSRTLRATSPRRSSDEYEVVKP